MIIDDTRAAGVGVEGADGRALEWQRHGERAEDTVRGGVLGVVRPALFTAHVVDEQHLACPAGVHTRSVPTLVLQLVSVQSHLAVVASGKRLLSPDQGD